MTVFAEFKVRFVSRSRPEHSMVLTRTMAGTYVVEGPFNVLVSGPFRDQTIADAEWWLNEAVKINEQEAFLVAEARYREAEQQAARTKLELDNFYWSNAGRI